MSNNPSKEHTERVLQWAENRGILGAKTPLVQLGKAIEEFGELVCSIGKGESPIDDIGDIRVCMINYDEVCERVQDESGCVPISHEQERFILARLFDLLQSLLSSRSASPRKSYLHRINNNLQDLAQLHNLTLEECDNHAWEQIKDRTGKNVNGEFVKD